MEVIVEKYHVRVLSIVGCSNNPECVMSKSAERRKLSRMCDRIAMADSAHAELPESMSVSNESNMASEARKIGRARIHPVDVSSAALMYAEKTDCVRKARSVGFVISPDSKVSDMAV